MKTVKLNEKQVKVIKEFSEYANELAVKYKNFTTNVRAIKNLPKSYDTLCGESWLLFCELNEIKDLGVNEENELFFRAKSIDKISLVDMLICHLYEITRCSALIEPYVMIDVKNDILELSFKIRGVVEAILE